MTESDSKPLDLSPVDLSGKQISHYRLIHPIGRGGMATVYRALDTRKNQDIALKVLHPQLVIEPRVIERFKREARALIQLKHPSIVPLLDYGQENEFVYLAMPIVRHGSLADRLAMGPISPQDGARIISRVAQALHFAHQQGIVHRDVKPGNILLSEDGNALLSDFGFVMLHDASVSLTGSFLIGTPAYMSPEQVLGDSVSAASDQYALGVMLYQMTTGVMPYEAGTPMGMAIKHATQPLTPPRTRNPNIPNAVDLVIRKALSKAPPERYESILEFNESFQEALLSSIDPDTGHLRRDAIRDERRTLELEQVSIETPEDGQRKRRWLLAAIPLALLLLCPTGYWAYRNLGARADLPPTTVAVQPTANLTRTAESVAAMLFDGMPMPASDLQTAVAGTLRALPTQTSFPSLLVAGTTDATLVAMNGGTEVPGIPTSAAAPTKGSASITAVPPATSTFAPGQTTTAVPSATLTRTSVPSNTPTPTKTPTTTVTHTPMPSNTVQPSSTPTTNICTLIDYQLAGRNGQEYNIRIFNNTGQQIQVTNLNIVWPGSNGALKKVELGGSEIWSGEDRSSPTNFSCSSGACGINSGSNKLMVLFFNNTAASNGYWLNISYTNGCSVEEGF